MLPNRIAQWTRNQPVHNLEPYMGALKLKRYSYLLMAVFRGFVFQTSQNESVHVINRLKIYKKKSMETQSNPNPRICLWLRLSNYWNNGN